MVYKKLFLAAVAAIALATTGSAQNAGGRGRGFQLPPMINIKIADYSDGGHIPAKYTCAAGQGSPSPAMTWSGAPATTQSYVVILPPNIDSLNDLSNLPPISKTMAGLSAANAETAIMAESAAAPSNVFNIDLSP